MATITSKISAFIFFSLCTLTTFAAKPINLRLHPSAAMLLFSTNHAQTIAQQAKSSSSLQTIRTEKDRNQTLHIRVQQTYAGFPVWGANAILHIPHATTSPLQPSNAMQLMANADKNKVQMNGTFYQDLPADLQNAPNYIFNADQAQKALQTAIQLFHNETKQYLPMNDKTSQLVVYVDRQHKAHFAFHIEFNIQTNTIVTRPNYLMDAVTFQIYRRWDNVESLIGESTIQAGGYGGNVKTGKLIYDGLAGDLPSMSMIRHHVIASVYNCYYRNAQFFVSAPLGRKSELSFACNNTNRQHNNIYWNGDISPQSPSYDTVNGGYSPANDALYNSKAVFDMYRNWYGLEAITPNTSGGINLPLDIVVHYYFEQFGTGENAAYNGIALFFGDGGNRFYPLTSPGVVAHEISHGFTHQHSNLIPSEQSGGINEAFSDMAAQAIDYYLHGKNDWRIGAEIAKGNDDALRYMDEPTKDCHGEPAGFFCSINHVSQYYDGLNVHHSCGVFNRAFYLLATSPDWNTKKAFDVMVQANRFYWTPDTTFQDAACGVMAAANDLHVDTAAVSTAFAKVGIDTTTCTTQTVS